MKSKRSSSKRFQNCRRALP